MNLKIVAVLLTLGCLLLGAGLVYRNSTATQEKKKDTATILSYSNQVVDVSKLLDEQKLVNVSLERDFVLQAEELKTFSNNLSTVSAKFVKAQSDAKSAAESAKEQLHRRETRIAELESERDGMTKKMDGLTGSISELETQIASTQTKLEASEGDREFLLKELKRLQAEKSDLERQFADLAVLRDQVKHLRDELSVSRRLEWIRRGLYGSLKGGELLHKGIANAGMSRTNYNLDVELRREGGATVLTNSPNLEKAPDASATTNTTTSLNK